MRMSKYSVLSTALGFFILISLILIETRANSIHTKPRPDLKRLISQHPPEWIMADGPLVDPSWNKSALSSYDNVVTRSFRRADGQQVMVVMTWSGDGFQREGHEQEVCFNASGFTATPTQPLSIATGAGKLNASAFTASRGGVVEDVVYWMVTDGYQIKRDNLISLLKDRFMKLMSLPHLLNGECPDNLMVRVTSIRSDSVQTSIPVDYIKDWLRMLPSADRARVMGR